MSKLLRPCFDWGKTIRGKTRCRDCEATHQRAKAARRPDLHNDWAERRRRAAVVADHRAIVGDWCPGWAGAPAHPSGDLTADHVKEVAAGGRVTGRLVVRCRSCNAARSAHLARRALATLGAEPRQATAVSPQDGQATTPRPSKFASHSAAPQRGSPDPPRSGMKAGPNAALTAPPHDLRRLPKRGGSRAIAFIERYVRVPKGTGELRRLKLRPWQRHIIHRALDEPRPRQGLVSMPAGNAKGTLGAGLGLYGLLGDGVQGAQVPIIASDKRQAGIIQRIARRMVELDEDLSAQVVPYHDYLYVPRTDSVLQALPAELAALQGWDPSIAIIDELHVVTTDVYESIAARAGKRNRSLLLALSTPPRDGDTDSVMWRLVEHGREGSDPSFFLVEFAAPPGADIDDEAVWYVANPALGDFLHIDALRATRRTMRDSTFRAWRLGQWPQVIDNAWLPPGAWDACADPTRSIEDRAEVVLGFDGSFSGDCTALVAVTVDPRPHVHLVALWEAPEGARDCASPS
jgi:hypothetical protein